MTQPKTIFFIVGTGRCGTQMLSAMLEQYPQIYVAPESHFIPVAIEELGLYDVSLDDFLELIQRDADWRNQRPWIESMIRHSQHCSSMEQLSSELYKKLGKKAHLREIIDETFAILSGRKPIIGDKTPFYGCFMSNLLELWPEAKFIHITRHPYDCAKSMQRHPGFNRMCNLNMDGKTLTMLRYSKTTMNQLNPSPLSLENAKLFWLNIQNELATEKEKIPPEKILEIRYEDLVNFPIKELLKIQNHLISPNKKSNLALIRAIGIPKLKIKLAGQNSISGNESITFTQIAKTLNYPVLATKSQKINHFFLECFRLPIHIYVNLESTLKKLKNKISN